MQLCTATGETIDASRYGGVQFGYITVEDVSHILTVHASLQPVSQLDRQGIYVTFGDNKVIIRTNPTNNIVAVGLQVRKFNELVDEKDN